MEWTTDRYMYKINGMDFVNSAVNVGNLQYVHTVCRCGSHPHTA